MASIRIRLKQSFHFHDRKDTAATQRNIRLEAHPDSQTAPEWIQNDPAFELMEASGHLELVNSPDPTRRVKPIEATGFQKAAPSPEEQAKDEFRGQAPDKLADAIETGAKGTDAPEALQKKAAQEAEAAAKLNGAVKDKDDVVKAQAESTAKDKK